MSAKLGFYYEDKVDWSEINMNYGGAADTTQTTWSCKDGTSTESSKQVTSFTFTEDTTSNCMANTAKSQVQINGNQGFFIGHWMRKFKTGDMTDDIMLMLDKPLYAAVQIKTPTQTVEETKIELCMKLDKKACLPEETGGVL